jgi:hypothetical protein
MKKTLNLLALAALISVSLVSCHRPVVDPITGLQTLQVDKEYLYNDQSGAVENTLTYTYSDSKVSKISSAGADNNYYTFEYTGPSLHKKNFFATSTATAADEYLLFNYNTDQTVASIEHYTRSGSSYLKDRLQSFTYAAGKLTQVAVSELVNGNMAETIVHTYTYTGANITAADIVDHRDPQAAEHITFTYDNQPVFVPQLLGRQVLFIDPAFDVEEDVSGIPATFSANNITGVSANGRTIPVAYVLEEHQRLGQLKVNNKTAVSYHYIVL